MIASDTPYESPNPSGLRIEGDTTRFRARAVFRYWEEGRIVIDHLHACLVILIQLGIDPVAIFDNVFFGQAVFIDRFIDDRIKIGWVAVILRLAFISIDQLAMDIHSRGLISCFLVNITSRHHILEDRIAAIGRILYRIERVIDLRSLEHTGEYRGLIQT